MTTRRKHLKLYVWREVLCDYSCGIIAVMAESADAARRLVAESEDPEIPSYVATQMTGTPEEWDEPKAVCAWGGG